jgi:hypothetical protein
MPKASAYGDEVWQVDYHKAQIGCSFHSNGSKGFRVAGLHTKNLHSTHSTHSTPPEVANHR